MTAILQHSLSSKQPIHFMPTEVSDKFGIETISAYPLQGYHAEKKPYIRQTQEQQVRQYSYRINRQPYNGISFRDKGAPELSPYRSKTDNEIQKLFDSIEQEK
ncbi:hypothetical protein GLOIN_2v1884291 [Rhizophagus clarus]|uniref:Uncharacterized protein n=1 Tax=Rhizophagus clarus TaxID=94130 RepID=A0A8H3QJ53_9GLOM|nr:hypothetical protein GLOIN_2v1884291 [Rhizophagus clarus]